jgi:hypothetical protein
MQTVRHTEIAENKQGVELPGGRLLSKMTNAQRMAYNERGQPWSGRFGKGWGWLSYKLIRSSRQVQGTDDSLGNTFVLLSASSQAGELGID